MVPTVLVSPRPHVCAPTAQGSCTYQITRGEAHVGLPHLAIGPERSYGKVWKRRRFVLLTWTLRHT